MSRSATAGDPAPTGAAGEAGAAASVGARLDAARWQPLHLTILVALGAGWLFDSFEVAMFGSAIGPLGEHFHASVTAQDAVLAVWLGGILIGALAGGRLADRFGRRRLFVATLVWYAAFTVLTGLSPDLGAVYALRFLAALGVGAEYAIVNAAIAEFMPARVRGTANAVVMNFWPAGAVVAGVLAYVALDTLALGSATSWRYLFVLGGLLAFVVLFFRRRIPESPRWLVTQGRHAEAEDVLRRLGAAGPATPTTSTAAPGTNGRAFTELVRHYPGRLAVGALLDLAEAFGYYGIFALLSVVVLPEVHIAPAAIPGFYIIGNLGALVGGLLMAMAFDRVGHRRTVGVSYVLAAAGVALLAWATSSGDGALVTAAFAVASAFATAAWTSAYPTFTELFPTHLRGVGVGASVAIGRVGAIVGTFLLPSLATAVGAGWSYLLVAGFWLVGAVSVGVYARVGGQDGARVQLERVAPLRAAVPQPAR